MNDAVTIESTIESWIGSCVTHHQLENMKEVVFDRVENETVRDNLTELIERKQKSLGGESKAHI